MNRKFLAVSLAAVAGLLVVFAASAITVYAITADDTLPAEAMTVEEAPEVAPVKADVSPKVVEPVLRVDRASYDGAGCPYSHTKLQLTEAPAAEPLDDAPIAQLAVE